MLENQVTKKRRLMKSTGELSLDALPRAVVSHLCAFCRLEDLLVLSGVSREWREISSDPLLWRIVDISECSDEVCERPDVFLRTAARSHGCSVQILRLVRSPVAQSTLMLLAKWCRNVQIVDVSGTRSVSDDFVVDLCSHKSPIHTFRANQCSLITDIALEALSSNAPTLENISLSHCRLITSFGVSRLVLDAQRMKSISLKGCPQVKGDAVVALAKSCPSLTELNLCGSGCVSDDAVEALANHCSNLQMLDISSSNPFSCRRSVTDEVLIYMLSKCIRLTHLSLRGHSTLSIAVLEAIHRYCYQMLVLDLGACRNMTSNAASVAILISDLSNLKELGLWSCINISDSTIQDISKNCRNLVKVDLDGCNVTESSIDDLKKTTSIQKIFATTPRTAPQLLPVV